MKREAWEAMNNAIAKNTHKNIIITNHQAVGNQIVEALHIAGFQIVPHDFGGHFKKSMSKHIADRQQSEGKENEK